MSRSEVRLRLAALDQAVRVVSSHEANSPEVLDLAQRMYDWLTTETPAAHLALVLGAVTLQDETIQENALQIHDDEQVTFTVQAKDARGFVVTDPNLVWSVDNTAVVSLQVSSDKQSATLVAVAPGSAVLTLTDTVNNLGPVTQAVDVVPSGIATISLGDGSVSKQTPATPTPAPATDGSTAPAAPAVDPTTATTAAATGTPNAQMAEPTAPASTETQVPTPVAAPVESNPVGSPAI